jgi:hypothetical protein
VNEIRISSSTDRQCYLVRPGMTEDSQRAFWKEFGWDPESYRELIPFSHIRTYRRTIGLLQGEIAFLIGEKSSSTVNRHELGRRIPKLQVALMYEFILDIPMRALLPNLARNAERKLISRAKQLLTRQRGQKQTQRTEFVRELLERIISHEVDLDRTERRRR